MNPSETPRNMTRRDFVRDSTLAIAGTALGLSATHLGAADPVPGPIPRAVLGRTGVEVGIVGLGTALLGHQNNNKPEIAKLVRVFSEAIELGLTYIDTARIYGGAEEALRTVLKGQRDKVFLATKVWANTAAEAEKSFHESLATLGVESVDVLHLHSAGDKDIDKVLGPEGAWEFLEKAKKGGKCRFLGITGHSRPANFVRLLETDRVDCLMVAMNFVDRHIYGFEEKVLPVAIQHKTGVMAMKVYGGVHGGFQNYGSPTPQPAQLKRELHMQSIRYVKSLPGVTGMVIGAHTAEQVRENIQRVLEARPLAREELDRLIAQGKEIATGWSPRFGPVV